MCPSAPRVCSEPGGQKPVLSLSLDRIGGPINGMGDQWDGGPLGWTNDGWTNEKGTNEKGHQWVQTMHWGADWLGDHWDGGPVRWGTNESGGPMRWGTNGMGGGCVLIGGPIGWGTNEMGDQWDGGPVRWRTSEMGDQWCAPKNRPQVHATHIKVRARFLSVAKQGFQPMMHWTYSSFALINTLWPSDAIWRQRSGSTLVQVMACFLMAPSQYLNQCWLIISEVQWHSYCGNFTIHASTINHQNPFGHCISKISFKFPRGQCFKPLILCTALNCTVICLRRITTINRCGPWLGQASKTSHLHDVGQKTSSQYNVTGLKKEPSSLTQRKTPSLQMVEKWWVKHGTKNSFMSSLLCFFFFQFMC